MTRLTAGEGFVWGAYLTLFAVAVALEVLGQAGILRPWPDNHTALLAAVLMIVAGLVMMWAVVAVEPSTAEYTRRSALLGAVLFLGLLPLVLNLVPATLVSPRLFIGSVMLFAAYAVWRNKKYPHTQAK
jgi:hypothetical protein